MGNLTNGGVCYDLEHSPFMQYRGGYMFFFSSQSHQQKFTEKMRMREDWLSDSLSRRFKIYINARFLADLQLYMQIEKRGFYIKNCLNDEVYKCPEQLQLDGLVLKFKD